MDIARITEHLPEKRALIGIQPDTFGWGMKPSAAVQGALDVAVEEAVKLLREWHRLDDGNDKQTLKYYDRNTVTVS
jgi:hydrogenase maturation protease